MRSFGAGAAVPVSLLPSSTTVRQHHPAAIDPILQVPKTMYQADLRSLAPHTRAIAANPPLSTNVLINRSLIQPQELPHTFAINRVPASIPSHQLLLAQAQRSSDAAVSPVQRLEQLLRLQRAREDT